MTELVTGELVEAPNALVPAATPEATISQLGEKADVLARLIDERGLFHTISGKKHVTIEGWQALGQLLGLTCLIIETERIDGGWMATAEVRRTTDGMAVGRATAICTSEERLWAKRDDNHRLSMAQTRAQSKALRSVAGVVTVLAGLEATPAEEMPHDLSPSGAGSSVEATGASTSVRGRTESAPEPISVEQALLIQMECDTRTITDLQLVEAMCKAVDVKAPKLSEAGASKWADKALSRFPAEHFTKLLEQIKRYPNEVE